MMGTELNTFDIFVDDLISSEDNLLKGELDLLIMQHIFNSLELNKLEDLEDNTEILAA